MTPAGPGHAPRAGAGQNGFALIIVLWTMVLFALLVTHLEQTGRGEAQLALNLRRAAALQAQADGAISIAAFYLLDPSSGAWLANGRPHSFDVADDPFTRKIVVQMLDQSGKIDLNTASPPLLAALLTTLGVAPAQSASIAANIAAWRFPSGPAQNGIAAAYKAAGMTYGPPAAPYEATDELAAVLGVTPLLARLLEPDVTVFHQGNPDLAFANPAVARAMTLASAIIPTSSAQSGGGGLRVVSVTATAFGDNETSFTRQAVLMLGQQADGLVHILSWTTPAR